MTRRVALVVAIAALAGVPIGYAVAQAGESDHTTVATADNASTSTTNSTPADWGNLPPPSELEGYGERIQSLDKGTIIHGPTAAQLAAAEGRPWPPKGDDPNSIGSAPPPGPLVERCRADQSAENDCGVVLAVADGKLPPGDYSDAELRSAVKAAGYSWTP